MIKVSYSICRRVYPCVRSEYSIRCACIAAIMPKADRHVCQIKGDYIGRVFVSQDQCQTNWRRVVLQSCRVVAQSAQYVVCNHAERTANLALPLSDALPFKRALDISHPTNMHVFCVKIRACKVVNEKGGGGEQPQNGDEVK